MLLEGIETRQPKRLLVLDDYVKAFILVDADELRNILRYEQPTSDDIDVLKRLLAERGGAEPPC